MSDQKKEAVVETKPAVSNVKPLPKRIAVSRFKEAPLVRNHWIITAEAGVVPDDLLEAGYWHHIASRLRPGDRIEVLTDDMRWAGDLVVHSCGRLWANVKFMGLVQFSDIQDTNSSDNLKVQYRGPHHRYCVTDDVDGNIQVIRHGFDNQEDAMIFLQEYRKTVLKVA